MNYYNNIKNELINNEINKRVKNYSINRGDLNTYYKVGKILSEAGKQYGEGIIEKGALMGHQLNWSHYKELIPLKNIDKINYYISVCEKQYITRDELKRRIKSKEYERLPSNKKEKINNEKDFSLIDYVKNPIIIRNIKIFDILSEKVLQKIILEDIEFFMNELGNLFSFIGSEYKIRVGNVYNYIDILLFNKNINI